MPLGHYQMAWEGRSLACSNLPSCRGWNTMRIASKQSKNEYDVENA